MRRPPLLLLLLFSAAIAASHLCSASATSSPSPSDITFSNCSANFDCGPFSNLSYPFTGGTRPSHCGPPEFNLKCPGDGSGSSSATLTAWQMDFRVLEVDQSRRSLILSRSDLYNNTCLSSDDYRNTTLNTTLFSYGSSNNTNLTLFYGCSSSLVNVQPDNMFTCDVDGHSSISYYWMGPVPTDPILNVSTCNVSVSVPILQSSAAMLTSNRSKLKEALMGGFWVSYNDPYGEDCGECHRKGGECRFDSLPGVPICICGDWVCSVSGSNKRIGLGVGLAVAGACAVGIVIGFCVFSLRAKKRRQREAAAALAAESLSKVISGPPSSKGTTTVPVSSYSRTTPSYPSSKLDLENGSTYFGVHVFSYEELEEATHNFDPARELGDGGFGTVYYGELRDGRLVAVKRHYENNMKRVEQFMNEVEILTRLRHQNLVTLYGCTSKRSRELLLVYEYIPNGTVADHLHGKRAGSGSAHIVPWHVRLNIAAETADALAYLHDSDVVHRDVKTTNILLDNDFRVRVADFGLSRLFPNDVTHVSTAPQGTPGYVDPMYYQVYQLTSKSDVYSFGVVLCELISSKPAVDTNRHQYDINLASMAMNKIQNHKLEELVDPLLGFETDYSVRRSATLVGELAFRCLQQEREMRPSMVEVVETLRRIKNEEMSFRSSADVVELDIRSGTDDGGGLFLKNNNANALPPPLSPDSTTTPRSF